MPRSLSKSKLFTEFIVNKNALTGHFGLYLKKFLWFITSLTLSELYELFSDNNGESINTQKLLDVLKNIVLNISHPNSVNFWYMFHIECNTKQKIQIIELFVGLLSLRRKELLT